MYVKSLKDFNYVELYDDIVFEDTHLTRRYEKLSTSLRGCHNPTDVFSDHKI